MKFSKKDLIIAVLIAAFVIFSLFSIAKANTPFTSVLEAEKNLLIEHQLELESTTGKIKEKLSKEKEKLERLRNFVLGIESKIQQNKDTHNMNTGKIQSIDRSLSLYEGLE